MSFSKEKDFIIKQNVSYGCYKIFDFLNMETYVLGKEGISSIVQFKDLHCLKGVKAAYEKLIELGGTPPEINFPENIDKPYDLTGRMPRIHKSGPTPAPSLNRTP